MGEERRDDRCGHLTPFKTQHIFRRCADHQTNEEQAADEGRGQQQLEEGIGGRLNQGDLPVGGGDERTALEDGFEVSRSFHWRHFMVKRQTEIPNHRSKSTMLSWTRTYGGCCESR